MGAAIGLTIINSYFSGSGGISSSSSVAASVAYSGGLVGLSTNFTLIMVNSYFSGSGGISSSAAKAAYSGGLVGGSVVSLSLRMMNSYFSGGSGGISSSAANSAYSGGLVGESRANQAVEITNSYFNSGSGGISSSSSADDATLGVGGLFGFYSGGFRPNPLTITNNYWNIDVSQSVKGSPQSPGRAQGNAETNPSGTNGSYAITARS